jgi:hypothetical protein
MALFDLKKLVRGDIPWDVDDCCDVLLWYQNLLATPKDDWDLDERLLVISEEDGSRTEVHINMFNPLNQLSVHLIERYDIPLATYHLRRFLLILSFLGDRQNQLASDGFVRETEGAVAVLTALCALPFSRRTVLVEGEIVYEFDYEEVVRYASELMKLFN